MKPVRKRVSFKSMLGEAETALVDVFVTQPRAWFANARIKLRNLPKTNYDLATDFAERGLWMDAIFRYRIALYLQPHYPLAWYNLGCCFFRHGERGKAKNAFLKALAQTPGDADALFMLAAVDPTALKSGQRVEHMPLAMVTGFFGSIAEGYDREEAAVKYQAGKLVFDAVKPLVAAGDIVVVDLGCGSGIASRPWRAGAKEIIGIDITPAMGMLATNATQNDKKLFDQLVEADIADVPARVPGGVADLVLAVNAVSFVGNLEGVMRSTARLLKPGGVFAITLEPYSQATGFGVMKETGRFGHANAYATHVAAAHGLRLAKEMAVELYPQTPAALLVFTLGAGA